MTEINKMATGQISIHALLAESDAKVRDVVASCYRISIHALLAESDPFRVLIITIVEISIHALLAESDPFGFPSTMVPFTFLSTLSLRRAT